MSKMGKIKAHKHQDHEEFTWERVSTVPGKEIVGELTRKLRTGV